MNVYENPKVTAWVIAEMRKRVDRPRTGTPHASELFQCLRKSYLNRVEPVIPDPKSILRFAVGYALQEWFLGPEKDGKEVWGVVFSADRQLQNHILEFKSTRRSLESLPKDESGKSIRGAEKVRFDPRENPHWILRTRAYCAAHNITTAHIIVFFIFGDDLATWTFEFDPADLRDARSAVLRARNQLKLALRTKSPPPVSTRLGDWECELCPRKLTHCLKELQNEPTT